MFVSSSLTGEDIRRMSPTELISVLSSELKELGFSESELLLIRARLFTIAVKTIQISRNPVYGLALLDEIQHLSSTDAKRAEELHLKEKEIFMKTIVSTEFMTILEQEAKVEDLLMQGYALNSYDDEKISMKRGLDEWVFDKENEIVTHSKHSQEEIEPGEPDFPDSEFPLFFGPKMYFPL